MSGWPRRFVAAAGRGARNSAAFIRRHLGLGVSQFALVMAALFWPGLSSELRDALKLAAIAALLGGFLAVEVEYQSGRRQRAAAADAVSTAARQLRLVVLSMPDATGRFRLWRRTVTLAGVGAGEQIDLSGLPQYRRLDDLRVTIDEARARFATAAGAQMLYLEGEDRGRIVSVVGDLEYGAALAGEASRKCWRVSLLENRAVIGEARDRLYRWTVQPLIDELHDSLRSAEADARALVGHMSAAPRPAAPVQAVAAAAAVLRDVVEILVEHGIATNWWPRSSLRRSHATMRDVASVDELSFEGDDGQGWIALNLVLREQERGIFDLATALEDLEEQQKARLAQLRAALEAARVAAVDAGEADSALRNAVDRAGPAETLARLQREFVQRIREVVAVADSILAAIPSASAEGPA